jgi:hypothetical protein
MVVMASLPAGLGAQEVPLGPAQARAVEPFSLVNTVRELSSGEVLVADPLGGTLVMLDPTLQRATPLGREGGGPGEYRQPDAVWPLPGDSTLLVDLGNARLTVISPEGVLGRGRPLAPGEFAPGRLLTLFIPRGVDRNGWLYIEGGRAMGGAPSDSVSIMRVAGDAGPAPLGRVKLADTRQETSGGANDRSVRVRAVPLSPVDAWGVGPDGSVAVARSGDYHLDWILPDGRIVSGPPVDHRPVRIRQDEREEWELERGRAGGGIGISIEMENGRTNMSFGRTGSGPRGESDLSGLPWPETKPPFVGGTVHVDGRGRAWVRRSLPAGEAPLYDVFDGSGRPVAQIRFPEGRRLVGFGEGTLYAVDVDDFDLQTLERYALP